MPTTALESGEVFPMVRALLTGRAKLFESKPDWVSETETVNPKEPELGGVPLKNPPWVSVNQLGKEDPLHV